MPLVPLWCGGKGGGTRVAVGGTPTRWGLGVVPCPPPPRLAIGHAPRRFSWAGAKGCDGSGRHCCCSRHRSRSRAPCAVRCVTAVVPPFAAIDTAAAAATAAVSGSRAATAEAAGVRAQTAPPPLAFLATKRGGRRFSSGQWQMLSMASAAMVLIPSMAVLGRYEAGPRKGVRYACIGMHDRLIPFPSATGPRLVWWCAGGALRGEDGGGSSKGALPGAVLSRGAACVLSFLCK